MDGIDTKFKITVAAICIIFVLIKTVGKDLVFLYSREETWGWVKKKAPLADFPLAPITTASSMSASNQVIGHKIKFQVGAFFKGPHT